MGIVGSKWLHMELWINYIRICLSRKWRRRTLLHSSSTSPSTDMAGLFFLGRGKARIHQRETRSAIAPMMGGNQNGLQRPLDRVHAHSAQHSWSLSQTLTDVLLKSCHDNTLKSPVCQCEREGRRACNQAGWCKTRTGSDFWGSNVQFGDGSRTASVAITLAHLSCGTRVNQQHQSDINFSLSHFCPPNPPRQITNALQRP